ncbi:hypothetical protein JVU11DRAFT_4571 [Chiua virens]|nr:hypothetical protein JVU11DRAFT_4571 [Chiua virens]
MNCVCRRKDTLFLISTDVTDISQITFAAVLCMLAIVQFAWESLQMYHATKQWKLNRYIKLLVQQGILHFLAIVLLNLIDELFKTGNIPGTGWQYILACILEYVPVFTLTPRFIIMIREMYAHDVQGRRGSGIDTGFGLSTLSSHGGTTSDTIVPSAGVQTEIVDNVDANDEGIGDIEEVPRERSTLRTNV